jgi:outer membrane protein assembly factor BamB
MSPLVRPACLALLLVAALAAACSGGSDGASNGPNTNDWPMMLGNLSRTGYNPNETTITRENVNKLSIKWKFDTGAPVVASPVVTTVNSEQLVIAGSYDGNVYAIRADDGREAWHFAVKPQPGVAYGAIASTAAVETVGGKQRVFVAGGETMYALDAATGAKVWEFDAGTGCTTCDAKTERNEITSSPAVVPDADLVVFGMDTNDQAPGKGGFYALSAKDGRLRWYFDVDTGATCTPNADDNIRKFDGFHASDTLGLPGDFFSTRSGCNFDRAQTACGNIWSPVSVDTGRKLIFFTSGNCDTDDDPSTAKPPPPMPKYDDALVALHYDGTPAWTWRPRDVDTLDLDFGSVPNLFKATIKAKERDVVGVGGKDGTYYLLDRTGVNAITGAMEPYWKASVVEGSDIGGIIGSAGVMDGKIYFSTAISEGAPAWALNASDGSVIWKQDNAAPSYGSASLIPGLLFLGGIDAKLHALDADTGEILATVLLEHIVFSTPAVVDGTIYVGSGFGTQGGAAGGIAKDAAAIWALCIAGEKGCEDATPIPTPTP